MIHILLCPHTLNYGGSQLSLLHWAKYLDKARFKVTVLAMTRGGLSEKFEAAFPVYYDGNDYPRITDYIIRLKPDILHAGPGGGRDLEYITKAAALVPVTQTVMCPRPASNYNDVVASVVPSRFVYDLQPRKEKAVQIDHPFDAAEYRIIYGRAHFSLPADKLLIGSFGNGRKENPQFIEIAKDYKNRDVHFVIRTDKKFGLFSRGKNVTVINRFLSEDEKMSLINSFDIFLYPTSNEAYGIVFLEAMSQKVPVITYDDSANREVICDGGLFAPLNDVKELTRLLDRLINDAGERKRLGEKGYELFLRRNSPQAIARKYEAFFEECLRKRGALK